MVSCIYFPVFEFFSDDLSKKFNVLPEAVAGKFLTLQ